MQRAWTLQELIDDVTRKIDDESYFVEVPTDMLEEILENLCRLRDLE